MSSITVGLLIIFGINARAARILAYYPIPSLSHQIVYRPITLELLKLGHEVTVVTPDPMFPEGGGLVNLTEIDVHDVSYEMLVSKFLPTVTGYQSDMINQVKTFKYLTAAFIEAQMNLKRVKDLFEDNSEQYDMLLLESVCTPVLGVTHVYRAPTILISSCSPWPDNYELVGAPTHPTINPHKLQQKINNLSLWEKLKEIVNLLRIKYIIHTSEMIDDVTLKKVFGPDIPSISVLKDNVDMLLLNVNPIWEGNYPMSPNVIYMGGLHQKPQQPLPKDLQTYLEDSINGVIYFSLGTNVKPSLLSKEKIAVFQKVFAELPFNIIWKWDHENFVVKSKNIKIMKWVPQADLLRHPNVKLFITQGGLQSTDEAITAGVPLIGIPMLLDQWFNVEKYIHHQIGVRLDFEDMSEKELMDAIVEVTTKASYKNNIQKLRKLMQDQPQTPIERTMWWIQYVLRSGGAKHLRAPTANIPWAEYLELELLAVLLTLVGIIVWILISVISPALKCVYKCSFVYTYAHVCMCVRVLCLAHL